MEYPLLDTNSRRLTGARAHSFQRARAAFLAISERLSCVRLAARALAATDARSLASGSASPLGGSNVSSSSPVAILMTWTAHSAVPAGLHCFCGPRGMLSPPGGKRCQSAGQKSRSKIIKLMHYPAFRIGRHRLAPAIQRGASYSKGLAGFRRLSNSSRQLLGRHHQSFSSLSGGFRGIPRSSEVFFWISSIVSTRARRCFNRAFSRSSSLTRGSSAFAFRPRFLDVNPALAILSRWRRQLERCDEYSPSRRRRAATSPSPLQASASRTIRSLYSAVKRRRFACSLTSGSGTPAASRPARSAVALRAPSDPAGVILSINVVIHDPPPPSTLISRGEVSQGGWHRGVAVSVSSSRAPPIPSCPRRKLSGSPGAFWRQ